MSPGMSPGTRHAPLSSSPLSASPMARLQLGRGEISPAERSWCVPPPLPPPPTHTHTHTVCADVSKECSRRCRRIEAHRTPHFLQLYEWCLYTMHSGNQVWLEPKLGVCAQSRCRLKFAINVSAGFVWWAAERQWWRWQHRRYQRQRRQQHRWWWWEWGWSAGWIVRR
jgi:hypothetical protein